MVVYKRGQSQGIYNSANIISKSQSIAMFITMEKSPSVKNFKGKARIFKMGLTKKFKSPKIIPKTKKVCHWLVRATPNKFDSGYNLTMTPGTYAPANQSPRMAAII